VERKRGRDELTQRRERARHCGGRAVPLHWKSDVSQLLKDPLSSPVFASPVLPSGSPLFSLRWCIHQTKPLWYRSRRSSNKRPCHLSVTRVQIIYKSRLCTIKW
jgi:hypothetical protein